LYIDSDRALTDRQTQLKLHLLTASRKQKFRPPVRS